MGIIKGFNWVSVVLFILFLCSSAGALAQKKLPPLDFEQFRRDVAAAQSPDEKLNHYLDVSRRMMRYHPDSLFAFAEEIQDLKGLDPVQQKTFRHFFLANAWHNLNSDSAIYYNVQAADQLKKINRHEQYLHTKNLLGSEYRRQSNYLKAEAAYLEGLNYSQSLDSTGYPYHYFYGNLGNLYSAVGAYNLAVDMFEKFTEYADNPGDRCNIMSRLAKNLMELENFEEAERTLSPCLEFANLPPPIKAIVRSNLSEIVGKMDRKEYSLALMEEAALISIEHRIPNLYIWHPIRLGNQYLDMNWVQQADSIRTVIEDTDSRKLHSHLKIEKALFLSSLALAAGRYEKTIAYADSAIITAGTNEDLTRILRKVYATKAKAYEKLGKKDQAIENYRLQDKLEEVQLAKAQVKSEAMMKVRYQMQKKDSELAIVNNQLGMLNVHNMALLASVIIIGLMSGFIYYRYRKSQQREQSITNELQKREVTIAELEQKIVKQNRKLEERDVPNWVDINSQVKLSLDDIRYIQSEGNYVKIFLSDPERTPIMERLTLKECEAMLPDEISLRIHRSTIVNIRHASHINNEILFLKDNTELKISRRYRKEVVSFLS